MTKTIKLEPDQLSAIIGTVQLEISILSSKIKEAIRDDHIGYHIVDQLTDKRQELLEIMKILEEKQNEFK